MTPLNLVDLTRVISKGYNDSVPPEQRAQTLKQLNRQRWEDAAKEKQAYPPDYHKLKGGEAPFLIVKGANHVDLYDQIDKIPLAKMAAFFGKHLK